MEQVFIEINFRPQLMKNINRITVIIQKIITKKKLSKKNKTK